MTPTGVVVLARVRLYREGLSQALARRGFAVVGASRAHDCAAALGGGVDVVVVAPGEDPVAARPSVPVTLEQSLDELARAVSEAAAAERSRKARALSA